MLNKEMHTGTQLHLQLYLWRYYNIILVNITTFYLFYTQSVIQNVATIYIIDKK